MMMSRERNLLFREGRVSRKVADCRKAAVYSKSPCHCQTTIACLVVVLLRFSGTYVAGFPRLEKLCL
jgi:hypothetical protein